MGGSAIIRADAAKGISRLEPELVQLAGDPFERAREEARRAGYEEGRQLAAAEAAAAEAAGARQLAERIAAAVELLENAALFVRAQLSDELDRLAKGATRLAFELTRTVLQRELTLAADPGEDAVARALALVPGDAAATVRLHPADLELLGEVSSRELTFVPDDTLGQGGCVLDTGTTLVDARIETALGRVAEILERAGGGWGAQRDDGEQRDD